jgi:hypothetical protein
MKSEPIFRDEPYAVRYGDTLGYILDRISVPIDGDEMLLGRVAERIPTPEERKAALDAYAAWWDDKSLDQIRRTSVVLLKGLAPVPAAVVLFLRPLGVGLGASDAGGHRGL